jgi:hypothetical protein
MQLRLYLQWTTFLQSNQLVTRPFFIISLSFTPNSLYPIYNLPPIFVSFLNHSDMKTKILTSAILAVVIPETTNASTTTNPVNYIIGGIVALFIVCYLFYSFRKPEEF